MKAKNKTAKPVPPEFAYGDVLRRVIQWGREEKIDLLQHVARRALYELVTLAGEGNPGVEAAKKLHGVLADYLCQFDQLCHAWPHVFEPMARPKVSWPGFITIDADIAEANKHLVDNLNLGMDAALNYPRSGNQWSRNTPATNIAVLLYSIVDSHRTHWQATGEPFVIHDQNDASARLYAESYELSKPLQPLSRQNSRRWFKAAWPVFIARYGKEFQDDNRLKWAWNKADAMSAKESKKSRGLVRRKIKNAIRQAFEQIAVQPVAEKVESIQAG